MTEDEISQKLRVVVSVPIEREVEVVYLFVEIRKLLDRIFDRDRVRERQSFPVLRMFCDWVAHTKLEKYGKGSVLESLDNALVAEGRSKKPSKEAFDIFSLERLRNELKHFLQNNGLPTNLVDDPAQWGHLVKLYVNVVSECPLVFRTENYPFRYLKSATLKAIAIPPALADADHFNVTWQWKLEMRNGATSTRSCTFGF